MIIGHDKYILNDVYNTDIYRMSDIWRYGTRLVNRQENVAEHSYYVVFKVYELGIKYNIPTEKVNKAARIAICHDCGEIYTGDLPYSLKFYSSKIKEESEKLELKLIKENFPLFYQDFEDFVLDKDHIVTTLVKAADAFSAVLYTTREEQLGNKNIDIIQIKNECSERYIKLINELIDLLDDYTSNPVDFSIFDGKSSLDFIFLSHISSYNRNYYRYNDYNLLAKSDGDSTLWYICDNEFNTISPAFAESFASNNEKLELII